MAKKPTSRGVSDVDEDVGRRLRLLRIQREMSQEQLAEHCGVSFQQIQKYEKGSNRLSVGRLLQLARLLKTTPHELIGWDSKTSMVAVDVDTYKLAAAFAGLREEWRAPVRLLINGLMRAS
jgi:transcriptional regulator with XRE-family HTH domain